jgi:2-oxoglutarate dehydrogenase E2 component (dihydrolipoamide succinyltransferase)
MKHDMMMPKMGESITEGTIVKWLKKTGDVVTKDEIILEISTDKVDSEIPTPVAGKIVEILAKEGETIAVGKIIARIDSESAASAPQPPAAHETKKVAAPPEAKPAVAATAAVQASEEKTRSGRFYSPLVLNIARTEGISNAELEKISGTGVGGRVTKKDVLEFIDRKKMGTPSTPVQPVHSVVGTAAAAGPLADGVEVVPMDHIRKKIAEHMVLTVRTSPHVGIFIEADMSNVVSIRDKNKVALSAKQPPGHLRNIRWSIHPWLATIFRSDIMSIWASLWLQNRA